MTTPTPAGPTLDDVLFQRSREPYSLRSLFHYLDTQLATELLDFWVAALDLRNMFEPEHPRSSYKMNNWDIQTMDEDSPREEAEEDDDELDRRERTKSMRLQTKERQLRTKEEMAHRYTEAQRMMVATYISDDAPLCINVSDQTRSKVEKNCPQSEAAPPTAGLFDECMSEVEKLIRTNYFFKFSELAAKAAASRPKGAKARPPPRPRDSRIIKGRLLTTADIAKIRPKDAPPPSTPQ